MYYIEKSETINVIAEQARLLSNQNRKEKKNDITNKKHCNFQCNYV